MKKLRHKIESDNFRAAAIWIIVVMIFLGCSRCKQKPSETEELLKHKIDSVLILVSLQDVEIQKIKNRKNKRDTLIILNQKKVSNETKAVDNFTDISRKRFADSVKVANHLNL